MSAQADYYREWVEYEKLMGRPPPANFPPGHPGHWQWTYKPSKTNRERLGIVARVRVR